jgi:hypothetical protein
VIEIEPDGRNSARTDIGAAPSAGPRDEFDPDFEVRVFHLKDYRRSYSGILQSGAGRSDL